MQESGSLPIQVRRLTKAYGALRALDEVDLDVRSGEFLTLLGPSGSGKTTLLMALAGFARPDHGEIRFGTRDVVRLAPHLRDVGMVFQSYALFPHMDVAGNVAFPLKLRGLARAEIARKVEAALDLVKLGGYGARRVDQLSGGQRQRVALARAIVFEPRILLMDEPLSALDKQLRDHMQIELRLLHERLGMTTVYVTHDQREALTMSDRIAVIDKGRIAQIGGPREIYDRPANRFVAEFIGESAFVRATLRNGVCELDGARVALPGAPAADGAYWLVLRPERLRLIEGAAGADEMVLNARVEAAIFQGERLSIQARLADGTRVAAHAPASVDLPARDAAIRLAIRGADVYLLPEPAR